MDYFYKLRIVLKINNKIWLNEYKLTKYILLFDNKIRLCPLS